MRGLLEVARPVADHADLAFFDSAHLTQLQHRCADQVLLSVIQARLSPRTDA